MSWHKLIERNDWESVTVHIGGPVVGGRFKTNLELKACKPALKAGEYKVRWPDGKEESLRVKMNSYTTSYDDMGHTYEASGEKPYFIVPLHGKNIPIYAMKLPIEVWRDE